MLAARASHHEAHVHDSTVHHTICGSSVHFGRKAIEVETGDRLLVNDVLANLNTLPDLAVEFRALAEYLPIQGAHSVATAHHHIASAILDHGVLRVAIEKPLQIPCVVRIQLGRHNIGNVVQSDLRSR